MTDATGAAEPAGAVQLDRRDGFLVRHRARIGLWPGQVSTAALVRARRLRRGVYFAIPFLVLFGLVPFAIAVAKPTNTPATVVSVVAAENPTSADKRFEVVLDTGDVLRFARDPGVRSGDAVLLRKRGSNNLLGISANGTYVESRPDSSNGAVGAVFFALLELFMAALILPSAIWGRRTYKALRADMHAPVEQKRGRYVGSWTWRGLTSQSWNTTRAGVGRGLPVAIEHQPGELTWYGAPVERLTELVQFETAIATGTREVTVTFHPNTRAIATLESVDRDVTLRLDRDVDELHPNTGLALKVSRRRRHAHLPDR